MLVLSHKERDPLYITLQTVSRNYEDAVLDGLLLVESFAAVLLLVVVVVVATFFLPHCFW